MASFAKDATYRNVSYKPAEHTGYTGTDASGQIFAIYYPTGSPSDYPVNASHPTQWSYVLYTDMSFWAAPTSGDATFSDDSETPITTAGGYLHTCLLNGIAVVYSQQTGAGTALVGVSGAGMVHAPGGTAGYWESLAHPNCFKDAILVAQHIQYNAATYSLCKTSWCWGGNSSGSNVGSYVGYSPNRAWELGTFGAYRERTIPNVMFSTLTNLALWEHMSTANTGHCFPDVEYGTGYDTKSATQAAVPTRYLREFSPLYRISELGTHCIPPTYCVTTAARVASRWGMPWQTNVVGTANIHAVNPYILLRSAMPAGRVKVNAITTTGLTADQYDESSLDDSLGTGGAATNSCMSFILEHINKKPWDLDEAYGDVPIIRRTQINSTGRVCLPPSIRNGFTVEAFDGDVWVGENNTNVSGTIRGDTDRPREFDSKGAVWFRAKTGVANVIIKELR